MPEKRTREFIWSIFLCVFAGSFQYGYNISSVNGPAVFIKDDLYGRLSNATQNVFSRPKDGDYGLVEDCEGDNGFKLVDSCTTLDSATGSFANCTECSKDSGNECQWRYQNTELQTEQCNLKNTRESKYATAVSIFTIGGIIGSFSVKFFVSKFGRKGAQLVNMVISIAAAANFVGAKHFNSNACLIVARVLIGLFAGLATGVCPMYIMELSSKEDRGWIGVLNQLLITIGILVAQIISLPAVMGKAELWGFLMSLTAVPAIIWIITYALSVESPRFLLIEKSKRNG